MTMSTKTEELNASNPFYSSVHHKMNALSRCTTLMTDNEKELVLFDEEETEREHHHFSFVPQTDSSLDSRKNNKVPLCLSSCSLSSSSTTTTHYSTSSIENNIIDRDEIHNDEATVEARTNTGRKMFWQRSSLSEFAIARSKIALEAANEALRRQRINRSDLDSNTCLYTISSVGRGSSAADEIHRNDERRLSKQGYEPDVGDDSDDNASKKFEDYWHNRLVVTPSKTMNLGISTMSIAEEAAAMARLRQQKRREKHEKSTAGNSGPDTKINKKFIENKENTKVVLQLVDGTNDDSSTKVIHQENEDEKPIDSLIDNDTMSATRFASSNLDEKAIMEVGVSKEISTAEEYNCSFSVIPKESQASLESVKAKCEPGVDPDNYSSVATMDATSEKHARFDCGVDSSTIASSEQDIAVATSLKMRVFVSLAMALGRLSWKRKRNRNKNMPKFNKKNSE